MGEYDEFAAWVADGWRTSARWDELTTHFTDVIAKLTGDLKHAELQMWRAINESDHMSDVIDLFHDALVSGLEDDRQAAIDAYRKLRGLNGD